MLPRKLGSPPVSSSTNHKFETMIDFFMNYPESQFIPYLRELNLAFKANKINTQTFVNLLTKPNRAGFTPLIEALYFQNINNNLDLYFSLLRYLFMTGTYQGSMNLQDYFNYLIRPNNAGFTPLLQALKSASVPNLNRYLSELQWIVEELPQCEQSYFDLFLTPNNSGFTPLLQVLYSKNHKNQQIYFLELERGYARGFIKNEDYLYLLTRSNNKGVTPMHELLRSNNKQILATYFRLINILSMNIFHSFIHYTILLLLEKYI
jgi:ankyrin repeat protein